MLESVARPHTHNTVKKMNNYDVCFMVPIVPRKRIAEY